MAKIDNFDNRYKYYFYGSYNNEDVFNVGLVIEDETIFQISETSNVCLYGLENCMEKYADRYNFDYVLVIKIPAYYLGWMHRDGAVEPFVPFLTSVDGEKKKIIPNLIYAMYDKNNKQCIYNKEYNPIYDPSGLYYSNRQLTTMYRFGEFDWYSSSINRNAYSCDELRIMDEENHRWEKIIKHHSASKFVKTLRKVRRKIF